MPSRHPAWSEHPARVRATGALLVGATAIALGVLPATASAAPEVLATAQSTPAAPRGGPVSVPIVVENVGDAATSGPVAVRVTANSVGSPVVAGDGWTCDPFPAAPGIATTATCRRTDPLAPAATSALVVSGTVSPVDLGSTMRVSTSVDVPAPAIGVGGGTDQPQTQRTAVDAAVTLNAPEPATDGAPRRFDVRVRNLGYAPTRTPVTVTFGATGPAPDASGLGWLCDGLSRRCTLVLPLLAGADAPPLSAALPAGGPTTLSATVDDGEGPDLEDTNDSASATAVISRTPGPDLATSVAPTGRRAGSLVPFAVRVRNAGTRPTSGPVSVALARVPLGGSGGDSRPGGAVSGDGWTCTVDAQRCTTDAVVAPGSALPPLAVEARTTTTSASVVGAGLVATAGTAGDEIAANDAATGLESIPAGDPAALRVGVVLPDDAPAGATATATVNVANDTTTDRTGPVDVAIDGPSSSRAEGPGWICTSALRCRSSAGPAAGTALPPITVRAPLPADGATGPASVGAREVRDDPTPTSSATASIGVGVPPGDVTLTFDDVRPSRAGEATGPDMIVHDSGAEPVAGPIVIRTTTALLTDFQLEGDGWACVTGPIGRGPICSHGGPIPAGGTLPRLRWKTTPSAPALFRVPVDATVSVPPGGDAVLDDNTARVLIPQGAFARELTGRFAQLVPATAGRPGAVEYEVENARPAPMDGPVSVATQGWRGTDGDGWRCSIGTCHHAGPIPASGHLPRLRGTIVPDRISDPEDDLRSSVTLEDSLTRSPDSTATVPASRGTRPRLAAGTSLGSRPARGATVTATASVSTDRVITGPVALRLDPSPGLVVESAAPGSGVTCALPTRCTIAGGLTPDRSVQVPLRLRVAGDGRGPFRLLTRASSADAVAGEGRTSVVPVAAGGDLTASIDSLASAPAGAARSVVVRVRNAGDQPVAGPIEADTRVGPAATLAIGTGDGWRCDTGEPCVHAGSLAPGDALPPLTIPVRFPEATTGGVPGVSTTVSSRADDDTVEANSTASATLPVRTVPGPDLSLSVAASELPPKAGQAVFAVRVVNVGGRPTPGPVRLRVADLIESLNSPGPATGDGWTCPEKSDRCVRTQPLGPGEAAPVLLLRRSPAAFPPLDHRVRTATVGVESGPGDTGDDSAVASVTGGRTTASDVAVAVSGGGPAVAGTSVRHLVAVRNLGAAPTSAPLEVRVAGPQDTTIRLGGDGWTCPAGGDRCRLDADALAPGADAPPLVATTGPLSSSLPSAGVTATASGDPGTPAGNDVGSDRPALVPAAGTARYATWFEDLRPVPASGVARGRLRVRAVGGTPAAGPVAVSISGVDGATGDGWACAPGPASGDPWRCTFAGALPGDGDLPALQLTDDAPGVPTPTDGQRAWSASVVSPTPSDHASNAGGSVSMGVGGPAVDLVTAVTDLAPATPGGTRRLGVLVRNDGPGATSGPTTVRLSTPTSGVGLDAEGDGWTCGGTTCTTDRTAGPLATLPALRVTGRSTTPGRAVAATVTATAATAGDDVPAEDAATGTVGVPAGPGVGPVDLSARIDVPDVLRAGTSASTVVHVRNAGAAAAPGPTTVTVTSPFGGTLHGTGWSCEGDRCVRDAAVPAGTEAAPIQLDASVPADAALVAATTIVRVASAAESSPVDDEVSATQGVSGPPRSGPFSSRSVSVAPLALTGSPGDPVLVQVALRGAGAGAGGAATTTVTLPAGLSPAATPPGEPSPTVSGRRLTWDVPIPAGDDPAAFVFLATVDPDAAPGARTIDAGVSSSALSAPTSHAATFTVVERPREPEGPPPSTTPTTQPPATDGAAALAAFLAALAGRTPGAPRSRARSSRSMTRTAAPSARTKPS
ncbi:hypothetical protein AB0L40_17655, partial [Patulibacter sp. NPDC049589]|uniref:hypothetical protein n=1 Tax=Patulibacter sp. NPDC049589 TaxID=3154731 RepID=UPI003429277E